MSVSDLTAQGGELRPSRLELAGRRRELLRDPDRLVTRADAARLLGVSVDTVDRRVRGRTGESRTSLGELGLPAGSLAEYLREPWPGRGRPFQLDEAVVSRIVASRQAGETFSAIAAALNEDGVATAHGGARWWPATVQKVVGRAEQIRPPMP
jgi:hypothetical protein